MIEFDEEREIKPHLIPMNKAAKVEWKRINDKITIMQNSDNESEFTKSMLPKQKTYVPRFALLLSVIDAYANGEDLKRPIDAETMIKAERLSDYFITMSKKVKVDSMAYNVIREAANVKGAATPKERCKQMWRTDTDLNRTSAAELLAVSRQTIINWIKEFENAA
jgi:hypothetical protein